ncbi:hypothetical protein BBA70_00460 [New Jersey aster yellows phytoplasma]|uniref:Uncharacterized protein n=1 Tax=New Jersey aster yellows phytoplasma TaxID=270520 RepID=A0ABX4K0V1_9MOLU|nr:hypothetical protein BBA70_00460 [New Jersey aster yellows phytoplasma]
MFLMLLSLFSKQIISFVSFVLPCSLLLLVIFSKSLNSFSSSWFLVSFLTFSHLVFSLYKHFFKFLNSNFISSKLIF